MADFHRYAPYFDSGARSIASAMPPQWSDSSQYLWNGSKNGWPTTEYDAFSAYPPPSTTTASTSPRSSAPTSRASSVKPPPRTSSTRPSPTPKLELLSALARDDAGPVFVMEHGFSSSSSSSTSSASSPSNSSTPPPNTSHPHNTPPPAASPPKSTSSPPTTTPPPPPPPLAHTEFQAHPTPHAGITLPMEVPLRATQASGDMRRMMTVFRLNPFASSAFSHGQHPSSSSKHRSGSVSSSSSSEDTSAGATCAPEGLNIAEGTTGGQPETPPYAARPLEEEPQMFEFQVELDDPEGLVPEHDRVGVGLGLGLGLTAVGGGVGLTSVGSMGGSGGVDMGGKRNGAGGYGEGGGGGGGYTDQTYALVASPMSACSILGEESPVECEGEGEGSESSGGANGVNGDGGSGMGGAGGMNGAGLHVFPESFEPNAGVEGYAYHGYTSPSTSKTRDSTAAAYYGYTPASTSTSSSANGYGSGNSTNDYGNGTNSTGGYGSMADMGMRGILPVPQRGLSIDNAELYAGSQNTSFYPTSSTHSHSSSLASNHTSNHTSSLSSNHPTHPSLRRWSLPTQSEAPVQVGSMGHGGHGHSGHGHGHSGYGTVGVVYGR